MGTRFSHRHVDLFLVLERDVKINPSVFICARVGFISRLYLQVGPRIFHRL